jgi:hypothetical protein
VKARPTHARLHRAWLATLPLWLCACIVPVGPQFQDPVGNDPPYLATSNPPAGAVLPPTNPVIEVTLGDPNLEDFLVGRWLIDYPPYDEGHSRLALQFRMPRTNAANRDSVRFAPNCTENQIASDLDSHRVTLSVADRPFVPSDQATPDLRLDTVPDEGFLLRATWILNLTCP